jgi:hypothetical protein
VFATYAEVATLAKAHDRGGGAARRPAGAQSGPGINDNGSRSSTIFEGAEECPS